MVEPEESPYVDEYGRPDCPIELAGAYIDKDNDRFGLVQDMISPQDVVNKATSKYMHWINQSQTWGNQQGPDANTTKKEAAKPDGHFELKGSAKFGEDFGVIPTDNKAIGALNLLNTAIASLSEIGGNQVLDPEASGRSKEVTAQTKMLELGPVLDTHRQCSKFVYRQVWHRIKQFWNEEKWIRVTDDENNLKFVMLNQPMTFRDALTEQYGAIPPEVANHPNLDEVMTDESGQPMMKKNDVANIDVDIIVEEAPDIINIQQEQFQVLAQLAQSYGPEAVPFEEMLQLSQLRGKDQYLERTQGSEEEQQQQAQMMQQKQEEAEKMAKLNALLEMKEKQAEIMNKKAKAVKDLSDATAQKIENAIVATELGIQNV